MVSEFKRTVIDVIKSAITGEKVVIPEDISVEKIHNLAMKHNAPALLYYGIANNVDDQNDPQVESLFLHACQYIALSEYQIKCSKELIAEFELKGIDHMPLKGTILRDMFPKPEMRTMTDADILIRDEQYEEIKPILVDQGYEFVKESGNEYAWRKQDFYLELHKYLLKPDHSDYFELVGDGWKFAVKDTDTEFGYHMSDEDFFVFQIVHFAKHYRSGGIGLKHMVDMWVYLNHKPNLDLDYVRTELAKVKLDVFTDNVLKTTHAWFDGGEWDETVELMTNVIFKSGSFGTNEQANMSAAVKNKNQKIENSRAKRFFRSVFLPYANMCLLFPVLKKAPILLPFLWVWRIIYTAFNKKGVMTRHYNTIKSLSKENIENYEQQLKAVGLEYRFEEDDD